MRLHALTNASVSTQAIKVHILDLAGWPRLHIKNIRHAYSGMLINWIAVDIDSQINIDGARSAQIPSAQIPSVPLTDPVVPREPEPTHVHPNWNLAGEWAKIDRRWSMTV